MTIPDLKDRRVLIVGGSSGIGRASAAAFLARGADVWIAGRSRARLEAAAEGLGPDATAQILPFDMTDQASVTAAAAVLPEDGIDHLVITASSAAHGPFGDAPIGEARAMFDAKFWGPYAVCQTMLPALRDGGAITLFSGVLSRRPGMNCAGLGAVNAAVEGLARGMALELGPRLRVNVISPGMVRTEAYGAMPEEARERMYRETGASLPLGRVGTADELAHAVLFAATNPFLTGQVIDVDGGHMIRQYATR